MLTLQKATELINSTTTQPQLQRHSIAVMAAMGAMAEHFNENKEHWQAIGRLHDYDYEEYPSEHLLHTEEPLLAKGVDPEDIQAILSHGYSICTEIEPTTTLEKSLYTVDELTGIIMAAAKMRPTGIIDLEISSFMKKFKDLRFAAKCNRDLIKDGCERLNMDVRDVAQICINAMREYYVQLELGPLE